MKLNCKPFDNKSMHIFLPPFKLKMDCECGTFKLQRTDDVIEANNSEDGDVILLNLPN